MKPDVNNALSGLKDFQRASVEHAFHRLWKAEDAVKRFLVADEVGLGKTMVAKGVIAKTVEHLWDSGKRIDIVYICSNSQIAQQNLSRLNVVGGAEVKHADRLTLLPKVIRGMRDERVNFVSFTPGTSFQVGNSSGAYTERVLLYWMLAACRGQAVTKPTRWKRFFEGGMSRHNFEDALQSFDQSILDESLCNSLGHAIDQARLPSGEYLGEELEDCVLAFNYLRGKPGDDLNRRRNFLVGELRKLVARAAVDHLEPDLVVLDEFQRFKDLLDDDSEGARLASAVFDHADTKVLLLSATPYKMYTLPDEPEGDDHYKDFTRTVKFLAGEDRSRSVEDDLRRMRETVQSGGDRSLALEARDRVQYELCRVMSRTEKLSSTTDRDGMLTEQPLERVQVVAEDLKSWRTFNDIARHIRSQDVFEYWRSTPYPLNLMERNSYQVQTKFQAAAEGADPALAAILRTGHGFLDWDEIRNHQTVDPGNPKLRGLTHDVLDRGAWKLAWLPPSLPYYELGGAYADPALQTFTKRLIFSAWTVVPKAVAVMMSYDADRRAIEAAGGASQDYDDRTPVARPLQFGVDGDRRPQRMPLFAALHPSPSLARLGDPLTVAREIGSALPLGKQVLTEVVRRRVRAAIADLPEGSRSDGSPDLRWYWASPFLLDQRSSAAGGRKSSVRRHDGDDDVEHESNFEAHRAAAERVAELDLGPKPNDLEEVLAEMAIAGPGVCALRALSRVAGGEAAFEDPNIREFAEEIAQSIRSLFNKPEIIPLVRASQDGSYWRAMLEHCDNGCLQAVLDEYAHILIELEGLQTADVHERARRVTSTIAEALSSRAASNTIDHVVNGSICPEDHRISSHFAARYGRAESNDKVIMREATIRTAFNSPFRPFVLASTSVGQEGLDFHSYCHAVVHWNLPGNPVDLEQREGRVHRYKGHAIRKNVAAEYGQAVIDSNAADPWAAVFAAAEAAEPAGSSGLRPYWVFTRPDGATIERYVPAMPLSRESQHYGRLLRTVGAYRSVIGQPRQDDLIRYVGADAEWLGIDLAPPAADHRCGG